MKCNKPKRIPAKVYSEAEYALQFKFYTNKMREKYYANLPQELSNSDSSKNGSKK